MRFSIFLFTGCVCLLAACARRPLTAGGAANAPFALRVLTYNIHHANPPSKPGVIDLEAIAAVIRREKPHLVALQEVDVFTDRSGKAVHEANELARLTGMTAYFAKAIDYGGGEYGVAILSALPMEGQKNTPLPTAAGTGGEPRTLASAVVQLPNGNRVVFASTHFDAQRQDTNRYLQVSRLADLFDREPLPVVVAGDLNALPGSRTVSLLDKHFTRTCVEGCGFTIPEKSPTRTIDYIAYKPAGKMRVAEHRVVSEDYASDHLPVLAVIEVGGKK